MRHNILTKLSVSLIFISLIAACTNNAPKNSTSLQKNDDAIKKEEVKEKVREFVYPLPSNFEITKMLNRIGASYIFTLSNPYENVEKYITSSKQALNLGIYGTDLSYSTTYQKKQETIKYLESSRILMESLNISSIFNEEYMTQVEDNFSDKEKLVSLITDMFYETHNTLTKKGKGNLALLCVSGALIEGLYIALNITITTGDNEEIIEIIIGQEESVSQLIDIIEPNKADEDLKEIYTDLLKIKKQYANIDRSKVKMTDLKNITKVVVEIRDKIIQ